jgi:hypothetical protein
MSIANADPPGTNDSQFCIVEHAVRLFNGGGFMIIGQCDDATV